MFTTMSEWPTSWSHDPARGLWQLGLFCLLVGMAPLASADGPIEVPGAEVGDPSEPELYELPIDVPRNGPPEPASYSPLLGIAWGAVDGSDVIADSTGNVQIRSRLANFAGTQVSLHRFGTGWAGIEARDVNGELTGVFNWDRTDSILHEVELIGGEPVFGFTYGSSGESQDCRGNTIWNRNIPPDHFDEWVRFVAAAVARYGDRVDYYEIWNEPDWYPFFQGSVERFSRILAMADSVVQADDPTADTILGGLALPLWQGDTWLEKLLEQPGQPAFDILGIHGYGPNQVAALALVDQAYEGAGLSSSNLRIWVTESGAPAAPRQIDEARPKVEFSTQRTQEVYAQRMLSRWMDPRVEAVLWYQGWDLNNDTKMGLVDLLGTPRPALDALINWQTVDYGDRRTVAFDADFVNVDLSDRTAGLYPVSRAWLDTLGFVAGWNVWRFHDTTVILDGESFGFATISPQGVSATATAGLYFDVDDTWRYDEPGDYVVTVSFAGDYPPRFRIQYPEAGATASIDTIGLPEGYGCDPPDPDVADVFTYDVMTYAEQSVADWSQTTTAWFDLDLADPGSSSYAPSEDGIRTATFILENAAMANGALAGSDFRIELEQGSTQPLTISRVEVAPRLFVAESPVDVGLDFAGAEPFSILPLDFDGDDRHDVLLTVAQRSDSAPPQPLVFLGDIPSVPGRAQFDQLQTPFAFGEGVGGRGAAAARLSPGIGMRLLVATPATHSELFEYNDQVEAFVVDESFDLPIGVWAGGFADYDLDGDMDLYLARAQAVAASGNAVTSASISGKGLADKLLEFRYGQFVDVTSVALPDTGASETISASWADVNGDRFPDLFVGYLGDGTTMGDAFQWSPLYINQRDGTFLDRALAPMGSPVNPKFTPATVEPDQGGIGFQGIHRIARVSGARFVDIDNDLDLDFVATRDSEEGNRGLLTLINRNFSSGYFQQIGAAEFLLPMRDAALGDFDNNGIVDFVAAPAVDNLPRIGLRLGDYDELGEVAWREVSGLSGLTPGVPSGVSAADYDLDGDLDIVYGRELDALGFASYYFSNLANSRNSVRVRLDADGSGNPELGVGARVEVSANGMTQVRELGAGLGRGSQDPLVAHFGIGESSSATYEVTWPDGSTQTGVAYPDSIEVVIDSHDPGLDPAATTMSLGTGSSNLQMEVEWTTEFATSKNIVMIEVTSGGDACRFGYTGVRGSGTQSISFVVGEEAPVGFGYSTHYDFDAQQFQHKLTYIRDCAAPCYFQYKVISKSKDRSENSGWKPIIVSICGVVQS